MSERPGDGPTGTAAPRAESGAHGKVGLVELEEVADELYEVAPEEFIAPRTTRQDEAKADGDKALAKAIGSLPKPSLAAWVCNLLVQAHRDEIEALVELGTLLRDAQQNLAGDELRALNTQRGQLLNALTRAGGCTGPERGQRTGQSIAGQVEDTLRAAMADREAGEALPTGRLSSPMSYSGMGTASARPDLRLVPPPKPDPRPAPKATAPAKKAQPERESAAERREREREEQRRAAEEKHRRELAGAQEAAEHATAAADEAQSAADEQRRQAQQLALEHADSRGPGGGTGRPARRGRAATRARPPRRLPGAAPQRRRQREAAEAADARDRALAAVEHLAEQAPR